MTYSDALDSMMPNASRIFARWNDSFTITKTITIMTRAQQIRTWIDETISGQRNGMLPELRRALREAEREERAQAKAAAAPKPAPKRTTEQERIKSLERALAESKAYWKDHCAKLNGKLGRAGSEILNLEAKLFDWRMISACLTAVVVGLGLCLMLNW